MPVTVDHEILDHLKKSSGENGGMPILLQFYQELLGIYISIGKTDNYTGEPGG